MVKWTQNAMKVSVNTRKFQGQHTSYKWGADHPVTVGLPGYQAWGKALGDAQVCLGLTGHCQVHPQALDAPHLPGSVYKHTSQKV